MGYGETIERLSDQAFLDKLYGFAYKRCSSSHEAEDLCADILLAVLTSLKRNPVVESADAFIWTVARRVYADFCEKRRRRNQNETREGFSDEHLHTAADPIGDFLNREEDARQLRQILHEIAFLSKSYRDVMVMFYLDGEPVAEIAAALNLTENTVKQRLFSARQTVKKEVHKMEMNPTLQPIDIAYIGTGDPVGNDPRMKAERMLSKNLIYLCKEKPRTAKELSEQLSVPMPFVEEELEIQCRGENGEYGFLRRLENGRYTINCLILSLSEFREAHAAYADAQDEFCRRLTAYIEKNHQRILDFPFLSEQTDVRFIIWSMISQMEWIFQEQVSRRLQDTYFAGVEAPDRKFTCMGIATKPNETLDIGFYGCDGNGAKNLCGYKTVTFINIYGNRITEHCHCGHNLSNDPALMMLLRTIGGLDVASLSEDEKEAAAKAIEAGYIRRDGERLAPRILVIDQKDSKLFNQLSNDLGETLHDLSDQIAKRLAAAFCRIVPEHLRGEYAYFNLLAGIGCIHDTIEACIEKGILVAPEKTPGAEGCWMFVQK